MNSNQKSNVLPIVMMFALFAMISFVTGLSNPVGVIIKNQDGIQNWMSQLGNFANFLAYLFMGLPSGLLLKRKGYKFSALTAIAIGILGVGIQLISGFMPYEKGGDFTPIFTVYLTGAFVSGFSMCLLNAVVNPMLNTLGGGGKKGNQLIQFGGSLNSFAATIVPILGGYLIGNIAKATISNAIPALFIAIGIFALTFIVLLLVKIPEPHLESAEKAAIKHNHSPLSFRHFKLGAIAIFLYVGVEVGLANISNLFMTTYTPEQVEGIKSEYTKQQSDTAYLAQLKADAVANPNIESKVVTEKTYKKACETKISGLGMNTSTAGSVVGTYWFLMLIGRFTGGSLGSKFSSKTMLTFVTSLGLVLVLLAIFSPITTTVKMPVFQSDISFGLAEVPISIMFLILGGLCTSVMWGGIFNLAVEGLGKYTAQASGFFMVMVVGGGVLPLIQGAVADSVGFVASYWVIFVGIAYMLYYALIGCKNVNKDIVVE